MYVDSIEVQEESLRRYDVGDGYAYHVHKPREINKNSKWETSTILVEIYRGGHFEGSVKFCKRATLYGNEDIMHLVASLAFYGNHKAAWRLLHRLGDTLCE